MNFWEQFRDPSTGAIDLIAAFRKQVEIKYPGVNFKFGHWADAEEFIDNVQSIQPIKSRQVAAVVIAQALRI